MVTAAARTRKRNLIIAITAALLVATVGYVLVISRAAGPFASVTPESTTLSGNAKLITESDGSKAISFTAPITTPPPPTPPPVTGERPNESNTGVPAGVTLKTWTGPTYDNSSNLVIDGYRLTGSYTFTGTNVTLKNCEITDGLTIAEATSVIVDHCKIKDGISIASSKQVTIQYSNIYDFTSDAFHITSDRTNASGIIRNENITITSNYVHGALPSCGAHADGMQVRGVKTLTLRNNAIDMGAWKQVCGQDALNAALFLQDANGGNENVTLEGNYLAGGGYTFYLGAGANTRLSDNVIKRGNYGYVNNTSRAGDVTYSYNNTKAENGQCLVKSDDGTIGLNGCVN